MPLSSLLWHVLFWGLTSNRTILPDGHGSAAFKAMLGYDWPGNLDELILTMERAVRHGQGDFIELGDLPLDVRRGTF